MKPLAGILCLESNVERGKKKNQINRLTDGHLLMQIFLNWR